MKTAHPTPGSILCLFPFSAFRVFRSYLLFSLSALFLLSVAGAVHAGDLTVEGDLNVSSNLAVQGTTDASGGLTLGGDTRTNWPTGFSGSFNDLTDVPSGLADGDDDSKWDGSSDGLNAATGRTSLGLGTAATEDSTAFAPADLSSYAGTNISYYNSQFHAQAGTSYTDADATNAVAVAWPNLDTDSTDDITSAGGTMSGILNMGGTNITNVADPVNDADAVNKQYLWSALADIPAMGDLSMGVYTNKP